MSDASVVAAAAAVVVDATTPPATNLPFDLSKFVLDRVLSNATNRKMICCLGRFTDRGGPADRAIVILEKTAFAETELSPATAEGAAGGEGDADKTAATYFSSSSQLRELFVNDIYGNFECFPCPDINRN